MKEEGENFCFPNLGTRMSKFESSETSFPALPSFSSSAAQPSLPELRDVPAVALEVREMSREAMSSAQEAERCMESGQSSPVLAMILRSAFPWTYLSFR